MAVFKVELRVTDVRSIMVNADDENEAQAKAEAIHEQNFRAGMLVDSVYEVTEVRRVK